MAEFTKFDLLGMSKTAVAVHLSMNYTQSMIYIPGCNIL